MSSSSAKEPLVFCVDTSAFIDAWERYYPQDVFPGLWDQFDDLMEEGTIISSIEVYKEMKKKSDGVVQWARRHRKRFLDSDGEVLDRVREIMAAFPDRFVDFRKSRSGADPFVIAVAQVHGAQVVQSETPGRGKTVNPIVA